MKFIPIRPIGTRKGMAFVDFTDRSKSGLREIETPVYPPHPNGEKLREKRLALDMTGSDVAAFLGISRRELSDLENGKIRPENESDWKAILKLCRVGEATNEKG